MSRRASRPFLLRVFIVRLNLQSAYNQRHFYSSSTWYIVQKYLLDSFCENILFSPNLKVSFWTCFIVSSFCLHRRVAPSAQTATRNIFKILIDVVFVVCCDLPGDWLFAGDVANHVPFSPEKSKLTYSPCWKKQTSTTYYHLKPRPFGCEGVGLT